MYHRVLSYCHSTFFSPSLLQSDRMNCCLPLIQKELMIQHLQSSILCTVMMGNEWFLLFDLPLVGAWRDSATLLPGCLTGFSWEKAQKLCFSIAVYMMFVILFPISSEKKNQNETACKFFGVKKSEHKLIVLSHNVASVWLTTHNGLSGKCR